MDAVVYGWLATAGNLFSTDSAHPVLPTTAPKLAAARAARRRSTHQGGGTAGAAAASYSRYSSNLQDDSSIDQQQRKCREAAAANGHDLRAEFEFADHAVSGSRPDRKGLQAMLTAAKAGGFGVLYFESLSRLAREFVISAPMLKELVLVHRVRVVSTTEGIDSDRPGWELMATFRSWMHTESLKQLREAVLRGQEEAVLGGYSVGHWCFGYGSEPVPGTESGRRGRNAKPRRRVAVAEGHAEWVRRIFRWFVIDRRPMAWIARELTRLGCPKDHRSRKAAWRAGYVVKLLRNPKYVGLWAWGRATNVLNPITGRVRQEECPPEDAAQFTREWPDLRIVDDVLFFQAQGLLDENEARLAGCRGAAGRLGGSTRDARRPRHLLQGLIKCAACGSTFKVAGAHGKYLKCDGHSTGACAVRTQLPRVRAESALLEFVGAAVLRSPAWRAAVHAAAGAAWRSQAMARPDDRRDLERQLAAVEAKVARLVDSIEDGTAGVEVGERLALRRRELDGLGRKLADLRRAGEAPDAPPTPEWIDRQLEDLHGLLAAGGPAAAVALRQLVGAVTVAESIRPTGKRKSLTGTFSVSPPESLVAADDDAADAALRPSLSIDFGAPPPWADLADRVKELSDAGVRQADIASRLGCHRAWPAKALAYWHAVRGSVTPDGRSARGRLAATPEALAQRDRVKALWDAGLPMQEIAADLGCCRDTVTASIAAWFEARGLPVPDGRERRKSLPRKSPGPAEPL